MNTFFGIDWSNEQICAKFEITQSQHPIFISKICHNLCSIKDTFELQGLGNKKVGKIHDNIQLKRQNNNQKWKQITLFLHLTLAEKVAY